jgi:hypothetical protein
VPRRGDGLRCGGAVKRSPPEPGEETTCRKKIDPGANMAVKYFLHSLKKVIKVNDRNHLLEQSPREVGECDLFVRWYNE